MPAAWPHQVGVLPARAQSFQHRDEANRLQAMVDGGGTAVLRQVLTGMGGVGKTQLATDYAHTAWDTGGLDVLVWVTASSQSPVVTGYAQAGVELCQADPDDPQRAAKQFLAWLAPKAGQRPCRWLIVLDDVADPADLIVNPDDPNNRFSLWPPASPHGRTLVTTRRRDAALFGVGRHRIEVGLFTEAEAAAYLTTSLAAQGRVEPVDQLTALASDLGHLPLALSQAAAYLIDSGLGAAAYRDLLTARATTLADAAPDRPPDEQPVVATTWSLSIDRADQLRPAGLARPMLQLVALLDANGIPPVVLTSQPALTHLAQHHSRTAPGRARRPKWWPRKRQRSPAPVTPEEAIGALRALHRLSLIDPLTTAHQVVRVHQLIQRATRDTLTPDQHYQTARTAADALHETWFEMDGLEPALDQALRVNTERLMEHADAALWQPRMHPVLNQAAKSLHRAGLTGATIAYLRDLLETAHHRLGPEHADTLAIRHNLAVSQGEAGDLYAAIAALEEVLASRLRVLGPDNFDVAQTRLNLGNCRRRIGDFAGARADLADVLAWERSWAGPDYPGYWSTRLHLAVLRGAEGDAGDAVADLVELLDDTVRLRGPDDVDVLITRRILAGWLGEAGDAADAVAVLVQLSPDIERILGADHPEALQARRGIAHWQGELGNNADACQAFERLHLDAKRILGPDEPWVLEVRHDQAVSLLAAGRAADAVAVLVELLPAVERMLGPDHPDTLTVRHNLAHCQGEAGDAPTAAVALAEVLKDRRRVLGADHPDTVITGKNLTLWQDEAGNGVVHEPTD